MERVDTQVVNRAEYYDLPELDETSLGLNVLQTLPAPCCNLDDSYLCSQHAYADLQNFGCAALHTWGSTNLAAEKMQCHAQHKGSQHGWSADGVRNKAGRQCYQGAD